MKAIASTFWSKLPHHIERMRRDRDRDETCPADERFFEEIAVAVASGGHIVVIGHGKRQGYEGDHLTAYLKRHHHDTYLSAPETSSPTCPVLRRYKGWI